MTEELRLQVFLSRSGAASRRKSALLIEEGRVSVNGTVRTEPFFRVNPEDTVTLDGKELALEEQKVYLALNKPPGYICSHADEKGRPLAVDLIRGYESLRLFNVGRLDFMSSGLIFFTNDGNFAQKMAHPSFEQEKEYHVTASKEVPDELLFRFKKGLKIDGVVYKMKRFRRLGECKVSLILKEGKNREIRRVFEYFEVPVRELKRVRIGNIDLGALKPGSYRELSAEEVKGLTPRK